MTDKITDGASVNNLLAKPAGQLTPADMRALCSSWMGGFNEWVFGYDMFGRAILFCFLMPGNVRHAYAVGAAGLAKSHMMKTSGRLISGINFKRIQCHSELTPTMIVGGVEFDWALRKKVNWDGEIINVHLALADELPRATPNTQAGFLEAMAEGQVTLPGRAPIKMLNPFVLLATANPAEQKGVYPLPEAQWDRFLFKLSIPYTEERFAKQMLLRPDLADGSCYAKMQAQMTLDQLNAIREHIAGDNVHVSAKFVDFLYELVDCTRPGQKYFERLVSEHGNEPLVYTPEQAKLLRPKNKENGKPGTVADLMGLIMRGTDWGGGAGPRSEQCLLAAAKIQAFLYGADAKGNPRHDHVDPQDLRPLVNAVLRHRVILNAEAKWPEFQEAAVTTDQIITLIGEYMKPLPDPKSYAK
jgi:MoxR-like ATPase